MSDNGEAVPRYLNNVAPPRVGREVPAAPAMEDKRDSRAGTEGGPPVMGKVVEVRIPIPQPGTRWIHKGTGHVCEVLRAGQGRLPGGQRRFGVFHRWEHNDEWEWRCLASWHIALRAYKEDEYGREVEPE